MRFRILKNSSNDLDNEKQEDKETETRQNSGNKFSQTNSFRDMVRNSYEFYLSLGKQRLKSEHEKVAEQKQEKIKKLVKKQKIAEQRQQIKDQQAEIKIKQIPNKQKSSKPRKQKPIVKPSRKSERLKGPVSYHQKSQDVNDKQIFDVLNIQSDDNSYNQIEPILVEEKSKDQCKVKKQVIIEKIQKLKRQLIFQEQGTYQIGIAHEALLTVQKFIDEHINFKHEIRQSKSIEVENLIKYVKSHGFSTFDDNKFDLLTKINPYLYNFIEGPSHSQCIMTFKLNGMQIEKRLQSTKRRMTQVSIPELFT